MDMPIETLVWIAIIGSIIITIIWVLSIIDANREAETEITRIIEEEARKKKGILARIRYSIRKL